MEKFIVKRIRRIAQDKESTYLHDFHEGGGVMRPYWKLLPFEATQFENYPMASEAINRYNDHNPLIMYQIEKVFI